ncbi:GAF and ANTAR domain-containing protein [uncultured Arthrobacter sp.]|uniref:GAF and ANTAR domain-containing protein n=1 Tax=uncultured Arthrobacter sp. TaxID=114050 RepID=UPI00263761E1|nr:GAF and ANTAR domain-containing protein [uncultured Arthrobacter sp.]
MTNEIDEVSVRKQLQDLVLDSSEIEEFLNGTVQVAAQSLSNLANTDIYCAITLLRTKRAATVASSSEEARKLDEVQYAFDDGPCLRAARQLETVIVPDFHTEDRFPGYREAIEHSGVRSAIGIPIVLDEGANAGLDLYCREPDAFNPIVLEAAELFAKEASSSLRLAVRMASLLESRNNLTAAMENRTTIDLAVGIIMGQNRCTQEEAVNILKAASSARNVKLHAVAAAIVESVNQSGATTHFDA